MTHARFSLNQATIKYADLPQALEASTKAGVQSIGLWRDRVAETGLAESAKRLSDSGLRFSSLCRGGFLTDPAQDAEAWESNLAAIEETATLAAAGAEGSAATLVMVVGGLPEGSRDLIGARERVQEMLGKLSVEAKKAGVCLALEPMHPVFAADRAVVTTLGQALDYVAPLDPEAAGVVVDTYHIWWDPEALANIERAGREGRIASFQVADWVTPVPEGALLGRGIPGDGHIDFASFTKAVAATGFTGDVETEVFHADVWNAPFDEVVAKAVRNFDEVVAPYL